MIDWPVVFLGVIAAAVAVMAAIQVAVLVYGARMSARVAHLSDRVERDLTPLFAHLQTIAAETARASTLAAAQVERADRVLTDVAARVEDAAATIHDTVVRPAREGAALLAGVKAALTGLREHGAAGRGRPMRPEGDDALFIG